MTRLPEALGLLVAGAFTGLATVAVHATAWGVVLGIAAPLAALVALPGGWSGRFAFAAGWLLVVAVVVLGRPEGDYAISSDGRGYAVLVSALVILGYAVSTLPTPRRAESESQSQPPRMSA